MTDCTTRASIGSRCAERDPAERRTLINIPVEDRRPRLSDGARGEAPVVHGTTPSSASGNAMPFASTATLSRIDTRAPGSTLFTKTFERVSGPTMAKLFVSTTSAGDNIFLLPRAPTPTHAEPQSYITLFVTIVFVPPFNRGLRSRLCAHKHPSIVTLRT